MKARQLVNVVMQRYGGMYSVSRINPEVQLFYPSTEAAQAAAASAPPTDKLETISRMRMPAPKLRLHNHKRLAFLPFHQRGSSSSSYSNKILCIDAAGHTVLYDADAGSVHPLPCLNGPKGLCPVSFSIRDRAPRDPARADALYLMARHPRCHDKFNFEALMYSSSTSRHSKGKGWYWHGLPPPPAHVDDQCHALIDDDSCDPILVLSSTKRSGLGTYCFNTVTNKWFKAGCWTLPFFDRAEHVPELDGLCVGIDEDWPYNFCAMDLSSSFDTDHKAPLLVYNWQDLTPPDHWVMMDCSMVYLGAGKFCIAKVFEFGVGNVDRTASGAVISGLEVLHHGEPSKLLMVKHKSKFYKFTRDEILCIL